MLSPAVFVFKGFMRVKRPAVQAPPHNASSPMCSTLMHLYHVLHAMILEKQNHLWKLLSRQIRKWTATSLGVAKYGGTPGGQTSRRTNPKDRFQVGVEFQGLPVRTTILARCACSVKMWPMAILRSALSSFGCSR